jgi:hypothetical protein
MQHQGSEAIVAALETGAVVLLVREPDNQYDVNAIAVWVDDKKIGYIPKKQNAAVAAFIDSQDKVMTVTPGMTADEALPMRKAITATFVRSPNSGYPMVQVEL